MEYFTIIQVRLSDQSLDIIEQITHLDTFLLNKKRNAKWYKIISFWQ